MGYAHGLLLFTLRSCYFAPAQSCLHKRFWLVHSLNSFNTYLLLYPSLFALELRCMGINNASSPTIPPSLETKSIINKHQNARHTSLVILFSRRLTFYFCRSLLLRGCLVRADDLCRLVFLALQHNHPLTLLVNTSPKANRIISTPAIITLHRKRPCMFLFE